MTTPHHQNPAILSGQSYRSQSKPETQGKQIIARDARFVLVLRVLTMVPSSPSKRELAIFAIEQQDITVSVPHRPWLVLVSSGVSHAIIGVLSDRYRDTTAYAPQSLR
jgi:hypothetical protein